MRACVYGPERGQASWPRVTAGIREGLQGIGKLAGYVPTDAIGHELSDALSPGFDAPMAIYVGPPPLASVMLGRGNHRHRLAMIAANSSWVPADPLRALEREAVTGYLAPSPWAAEVLRTHTSLPVHVYLHGISNAFGGVVKRPPRDFRAQRWHVLHLASTHLQRKGTRELIEGWASAIRDGDIPIEGSRLRLICDGPRGYFDSAIHKASRGSIPIADTYVVRPRMELGAADATEFYQHHDLVAQPSRAEGFGMVPLEARACGVPVLATTCTGHACHIPAAPPALGRGDGIVRVRTGEDAPIDDGPGALAPSLDPADITEALLHAYHRRGDLALDAALAAPKVHEQWSWQRVTERFLSGLR